jgi:hypothetical protein
VSWEEAKIGTRIPVAMMYSTATESEKAQQADGGFKDAFKMKCVQKKDGSTLRQHERVWRPFIHRPVRNGSNAVKIRLFLKAFIQNNS